jgi:hypothetical protein
LGDGFWRSQEENRRSFAGPVLRCSRDVAKRKRYSNPGLPTATCPHQDTRAKPLFIDFRSPIFVELFRQRLVESEQLTMEEVLPAIDQGIEDEAGVRWAVELQIDSLLLPT